MGLELTEPVLGSYLLLWGTFISTSKKQIRTISIPVSHINGTKKQSSFENQTRSQSDSY